MAKFILGYKGISEEVTVDGRNLTLYKTKAEADYDSEEWVEVEAETELEARGRYEKARIEWLFAASKKQREISN